MHNSFSSFKQVILEILNLSKNDLQSLLWNDFRKVNTVSGNWKCMDLFNLYFNKKSLYRVHSSGRQLFTVLAAIFTLLDATLFKLLELEVGIRTANPRWLQSCRSLIRFGLSIVSVLKPLTIMSWCDCVGSFSRTYSFFLFVLFFKKNTHTFVKKETMLRVLDGGAWVWWTRSYLHCYPSQCFYNYTGPTNFIIYCSKSSENQPKSFQHESRNSWLSKNKQQIRDFYMPIWKRKHWSSYTACQICWFVT